ncbi:Uncharacterised protein [Starkeya nomas]|uniref:Uncharacterized protein n=1 Tax=Starkeya nomas TaxID=2666134 RepID=A0A5S9NZ88_9HYPH|nr:DUF2158 domain-containing protein [Starkeya nomas]CAA0096163.1 Uncharacterised protein [Starkeya nomas]
MAARRKTTPPIDNEARDYVSCTPAALQQLKQQGFFFQHRFEGPHGWHNSDLAGNLAGRLADLGHEVKRFETKSGGVALWSRWSKEVADRANCMAPSPWPFFVGDVVQLKSGGGKMVVSELLCLGKVRVIYWNDAVTDRDLGGFLHDADLDPKLLHRVEPVRSDADTIPF